VQTSKLQRRIRTETRGWRGGTSSPSPGSNQLHGGSLSSSYENNSIQCPQFLLFLQWNTACSAISLGGNGRRPKSRFPSFYQRARLRHFFFFGYQATRIRNKQTTPNTILPHAPPQLAGDFSSLLPGTKIIGPYYQSAFPGQSHSSQPDGSRRAQHCEGFYRLAASQRGNVSFLKPIVQNFYDVVTKVRSQRSGSKRSDIRQILCSSFSSIRGSIRPGQHSDLHRLTRKISVAETR